MRARGWDGVSKYTREDLDLVVKVKVKVEVEVIV
jgi:hypothetical protein